MRTRHESPETVEQRISLGIAITSAPRAVPTLSDTLHSMRAAGFAWPITLFIDGDVVSPLGDKIRVRSSSEQVGEVGNWARAARFMLGEGYDYILMCQDDVQFCWSARESLESGIVRANSVRLGFLSLYTPRANLLRTDFQGVGEGWHRLMPSQNTWGALAWCFPKRALKAVTSSTEFERAASGRVALDRLVCGILGTLRFVCFQHLPSLARHTGQVSTLKHRENPGKEAVGFHPM
jgi:hypothetical protein